MLYLPSLNAIFFHIPKTGGTTLTALLRPYVDLPTKAPPLDIDRAGGANWRGYARGWQGTHHLDGFQHSTYSQCEETYGKLLRNCFKFAFVRNPWDRTASIWRTFLQEARPFDEVIERFLPEHSLTSISQRSYLVNRDGQVKMDFIGRFEHYEQDVRRLFDRLGIKYDKLPHLLPSSSGAHYSIYCSDSRSDRAWSNGH